MTLLAEALRSERASLEEAVKTAVLRFQKNTGISVAHIEMKQFYAGGVVQHDDTDVCVAYKVEEA